jgi:hypothetical protein
MDPALYAATGGHMHNREEIKQGRGAFGKARRKVGDAIKK